MYQLLVHFFPVEKALKVHDTIDTLYFRNDNYKNNRVKPQLIPFIDDTTFMNIINALTTNTRIVIDFNIDKVSVKTGQKNAMGVALDLRKVGALDINGNKLLILHKPYLH